jgi:hypothetical protein
MGTILQPALAFFAVCLCKKNLLASNQNALKELRDYFDQFSYPTVSILALTCSTFCLSNSESTVLLSPAWLPKQKGSVFLAIQQRFCLNFLSECHFLIGSSRIQEAFEVYCFAGLNQSNVQELRHMCWRSQTFHLWFNGIPPQVAAIETSGRYFANLLGF